MAQAWNDALASCYKTSTLFQGKRYGFPVEGGDLLMLYINTDHFTEAGIDPEKDYPKTIEDFLAAAQKLTKYDANGKIIRSGYHPRYTNGGNNIQSKFYPFVQIFGGRYISPDLKKAQGYINGAETMAAFRFYQDMVSKYKVINMELGLPEPAFQSGQTSMIIREGGLQKIPLIRRPISISRLFLLFPGKRTLSLPAARSGKT